MRDVALDRLAHIRLSMAKPDLDAVLARRAVIASELAALDKLRTEMEAEGQELDVAERVLKRLATSPPAEAPAPI
jgi:hypothetical protein